MSARRVPKIALIGDRAPATLLFHHACHLCAYPAVGRSEGAVLGAMDAHARYINAHADRTSDPHFADLRLEALIRA